ncbi:hypothetical protein [Arthrobacter sp. Br18]|uniref:hypothetical protein n=1 Tax=Arthrobacter sp. Br18 TaxID=1312954 RepID=UPI0004B65812|nr:hypothetical protein [Arthrobacter sp. Br18]
MPPLDSLASGSPPTLTLPAGTSGAAAITSTGGALFHAGELFSSEELQAMRLDGLVRRIYGGSYLRADYTEDAAVRAQCASRSVPRGLRSRVALGRQCAAWIYGCAPPPHLLSLVTDHRRRTTSLPLFSAAVLHQASLGPFDINLIAGIPVTTPLRTALDIAIHGEDGSAVEILREIASSGTLDCRLRLVEAALTTTRRVPGRTKALARLRQAQAPPTEGQEPPDARPA